MNEFGLDHLTRFWYAKVYSYCDAPTNAKLEAMNRILALDPNMPLPYLTRGQIRMDKGDYEGAVTDFNTYRKLLPHRPEGYIGLGQVANHLNDKTQARYWLEKGQYWLKQSH
jgi:predicted Zn-dependent protease